MIQADPRELTPVRRAAASTGEGTFCIERFRIAARDSAGDPKLFLGAVRTEEVTKTVVALPDRMDAYHPHAVLYLVTSDAWRTTSLSNAPLFPVGPCTPLLTVLAKSN